MNAYGNSNLHGMWLLGGHITNLKMRDVHVHDCNRNGIQIHDYGAEPTSSDWDFRNVRFERNMLLTSGSSQAHFRDATQVGVHNLTVDHCYFGPTQNPDSLQDYDLTPYWAGNLRITNCLFDRGGGGTSLGASLGSYTKIFPINRLIFENNIFYRTRTCFDPDSNVFGIFRNNIFYEVKESACVSPYSRHFPSIFEGNIFYNCHAEQDSADSDPERSAFWVPGDGMIIRNNYVIDDRKLLDPSNSLSLTQTAGGSMGARTYYVRFTFANSTGETLATASQSVSVNANNLLHINNVGFDITASGATEMRYYVGTVSGSETLQGTIDMPNTDYSWTEPTSGLVAGSAVPVSNTTHTQTKFGIYEKAGNPAGVFGNFYHDNYFIGIETPIHKHSSYKRVCHDNYSDATYGQADGDVVSLEENQYDQGNVSGATTFSVFNGNFTKATLTGNITVTLAGGDFVGQQMTLKLVQDAAGNRTCSWPGNFKKAGGSLILSTAAAATDVIRAKWDGTNWIELSRALNVS